MAITTASAAQAPEAYRGHRSKCPAQGTPLVTRLLSTVSPFLLWLIQAGQPAVPSRKDRGACCLRLGTFYLRRPPFGRGLQLHGSLPAAQFSHTAR